MRTIVKNDIFCKLDFTKLKKYDKKMIILYKIIDILKYFLYI